MRLRKPAENRYLPDATVCFLTRAAKVTDTTASSASMFVSVVFEEAAPSPGISPDEENLSSEGHKRLARTWTGEAAVISSGPPATWFYFCSCFQGLRDR
ncbi:hypothetical protein HPB50_002807 [Hyalomma asiaticum]|uniref:Uncharacterized protein n=1 Tax=Hyalomma asiaticum TaxID=266040 RepID=A0ACB7S778_HYAAI|nr:hypothetical protein HPB50_002807 [Hyalomma asiaticum]